MDVSRTTGETVTHLIPDDAFVRRRIHVNDVELGVTFSILPRAFRPSTADADGLSVYLDETHRGASPCDLAAAGRGGINRYVIVALRVGDLRKIGISVIAKDIPDGLPGHAVIPELNVTDYTANKQSKRAQKVLQMKLSELASQAIVFPPDSQSRFSH